MKAICVKSRWWVRWGGIILLFLTNGLSPAAQVTIVPPFIGNHSETWEQFGVKPIRNGTSILGGTATISGDHMVTAHSFIMCSVIGRPSDGTILMDSDRPSGPLTISFSQPVSAFGAYWGSGLNCPDCCTFNDAPSILTFRDINGNVIGSDSFFYKGDGALMWRGYRFATPVKTIIRTAGDGQEGVAMDGLQAIVASPPRAVLGDLNGDGKTDFVLYNASTRHSAVWYLNNNTLSGGAYAPTIATGWTLVDLADFDGDGHLDYALFNPSSGQTAIWYLAGVSLLRGAFGPTLPPGWQLVATADFNRDGKPDCLLFNAGTKQTALWYLNNTVRIGAALGPAIPAGWNLAGVSDFDRDGKTDYLLFNSSTKQSAIWYLSGPAFTGGQLGPTIVTGYELVGTADFNRDGKADYLLYNSGTRQTAIWYLNNNTLAGGSYGPTITAGWSWPTP